MILSMTGFGKAVVEINDKKITAEIKSLNSKQLDLTVRIPQQYRECELPLRSLVASELERGKVDLVISTESNIGISKSVINKELAEEYKAQITELSQELGIPHPEDWYSVLLRMPDIMKTEIPDMNDAEKVALNDAVSNAIKELVAFRTQEGNRLELFFKEKIENIQQLLNEVPKYEQERIEKIRGRIVDALEKLKNEDYDKNRLEQEMIFYIEKLDITEEKLRLQNHLDYFLSTMETGHGQGKKLGFISQEMGREINTLGSKANHAELQRIVVRMKDQLEQIKEQVLNVM
ncbi:MAG: YicC family protein [Bacteroidetes bacterium]|uniref:YicC family protein n=1 Tax=Candidatus Limisoma faecipullorum TaxID=2840854 RepID=A0A9D9IPU3_9BACT|nr:YicC family protein [Candidatus Limisoma faecipullorum]